MGSEPDCVILMDNGSLRPEATLNLRCLAEVLGARLGRKVWPVSLLHSGKVEPELLDGVKADVMVPFLREQYTRGARRFMIVPLFFGPSAAFTEYLPSRVDALREEGLADLEVFCASPLVCMDEGDVMVAKIMAGQVRKVISEAGLVNPAVAMVDHGTPLREVNEVRERVAALLADELAGEVSAVRACSMERREGSEYDFNEPLLENLLGSEGFEGAVVVSLLFAAPGRHAGKDGDIQAICERCGERFLGLETYMSGLFSEDLAAVTECLYNRYSTSLKMLT